LNVNELGLLHFKAEEKKCILLIAVITQGKKRIGLVFAVSTILF